MNNVITSRVAIGWIVDTLQKIRRASSTFLKQPVFVFIASFILCFHFFSCTNAQKKFDDLMTKGKVQFNKADHFSRSAEDTVSTWEGGFTKAIQYLEEAVKLNPNDAEAHYYLGHAYDRFYCTISPGTNIPNIRLDEVKKISEQFQRVIELRTNYSTPLVNVGPRSKLTGIWGSLAMAYITRGEIDSAKWAFMQGQKAGGFPQAILEYCRNILTCCEQNAILFVSGDNDTFPMLFLQIAEGFRTDVNVLNHPLLNTSWYLKFNHHGIASVFNTVKMSFTDNELENLELKVYKENVYSLHVPQKFFRQYGITDKLIIQKGQMSWLLKPTFEDACGTSALYPHDIVILDIIKSNEWVRPIYFSTTLEHKNFLSLDEYLRLDGLTYKLTPVREQDSTKRINRDGLKQLLSLDKVKSSNDISPLLFQGLKDKTSIYDIDIRGFVISQYIRLFLEYVKSFGQLKSKEDVKEVLNRIEEVIPLSNAKLDFPLHDELFGLYKFIGEEARLKMLVESNTK